MLTDDSLREPMLEPASSATDAAERRSLFISFLTLLLSVPALVGA